MPGERRARVSFGGGEIDSRLFGRTDLPQYRSSLLTCENFFPTRFGGLEMRPSLRHQITIPDKRIPSQLKMVRAPGYSGIAERILVIDGFLGSGVDSSSVQDNLQMQNMQMATTGHLLAVNQTGPGVSAWALPAGTADNSAGIANHGRSSVRGVFHDDTTLWVVSFSTSLRPTRLTAFNLGTGERDASKDVSRSEWLNDGFYHGGYFWAASGQLGTGSGTRSMLAYNLSTNLFDSSREVIVEDAILTTCTTDGTTIWLVNSGRRVGDDFLPGVALAYALADQSRDSAKDIALGDGDWYGSACDGTTLWFVEGATNNALAYTAATQARDMGSDVSLGVAPGNSQDTYDRWSGAAYLMVAQVPRKLGKPMLFPGNAQVQVVSEQTDDADSYDLQRATSDSGPWTDVTGNGPEWTVTGLTNGTRYYFRVRGSSTNGDGDWSDPASAVPGTTGYLYFLSANPNRMRAFSLPSREEESDRTIDLGADAHTGLVAKGAFLFAVFHAAHQATKYSALTGNVVTGESIILSSDLTSDLWWPGTVAGTTGWFIEDLSNFARAYNLASSTRLSSLDIDLGEGDWRGGASDGTTIWFVDDSTDMAVAYAATDGSRNETNDIDLSALAEASWQGGAGDGTTIWFVDDTSNMARAYTASTRVRDATMDFAMGSSAWRSGGHVSVADLLAEDAQTAPAVPSAPTIVVGNGQLTVTVTQVPGADTYDLQQAENSGGPWNDVAGDGPSWTITGLTNGTTYYFQVRASNAHGDSAYSAEASGTPNAMVPEPPPAPVLPAAPAAPGSRIEAYSFPHAGNIAFAKTDLWVTSTSRVDPSVMGNLPAGLHRSRVSYGDFAGTMICHREHPPLHLSAIGVPAGRSITSRLIVLDSQTNEMWHVDRTSPSDSTLLGKMPSDFGEAHGMTVHNGETLAIVRVLSLYTQLWRVDVTDPGSSSLIGYFPIGSTNPRAIASHAGGLYAITLQGTDRPILWNVNREEPLLSVQLGVIANAMSPQGMASDGRQLLGIEGTSLINIDPSDPTASTVLAGNLPPEIVTASSAPRSLVHANGQWFAATDDPDAALWEIRLSDLSLSEKVENLPPAVAFPSGMLATDETIPTYLEAGELYDERVARTPDAGGAGTEYFTPKNYVDHLGNEDGDGAYPACATVYLNRMMFGGSEYLPAAFIGSEGWPRPMNDVEANADAYAGLSGEKIALYEFYWKFYHPRRISRTEVDVSTAADSFAYQIAAEREASIVWMVPYNNYLLIGTTQGIWIARELAPDTAPEITQFSSIPVGDVDPVVTDFGVCYASQDRKEIYVAALGVGFESPVRINLLDKAQHLTEGTRVRQLAWQTSPQRRLWVLTDNGRLYALCYEPGNDVLGWVRIVSREIRFAGVCVIPTNEAQVPVVLCYRDSESGPFGRATIHMATLDGANYLDLETEEIVTPDGQIPRLDAGYEDARVVRLGPGAFGYWEYADAVDQVEPGDRVAVGVRYQGKARITGPVSLGDGSALSQERTIMEVSAGLHQSRGGKVRQAGNNYVGEAHSLPSPDLIAGLAGYTRFTGERRIQLHDLGIDPTATVQIEQDEPFPLEITYLSLDIEAGE